MNELSEAFAGRYRIERCLGEGGMATVYLAEDLKHDRRVALKVLRPELAAVLGAERFVSEIRTTASLQHPNILPLFDSGQAQVDGQSVLYYVMPYIDGETLREKIDRERQLAVKEAVQIARAVAAALDYAHRKGIVHRDIKPDNVLLFEGQALVADFGIALAVSHAGGERITETGLSVGTPHYMSPEQASADRTIDARTDIYSLGVVTFEMLAGRRPFEAATTRAVMSKIVMEDAPSLRAERPGIPASIDAAVQVALAKVPADRFATAAEFSEALANPAFTSGTVVATQSRVVAGRARRMMWPVLTAALALLAWRTWPRESSSAVVERVQVDLPEGQYLGISGSRSSPLAISPDGTRIVYVGETGNGMQLFVRELSSFESRPLDGTSGGNQPFFSPDGKWVGYFGGGALWRVAVNGGAPIEVARFTGPSNGGSWNARDEIIFALDSGLFVVKTSGAAPRRLPFGPANDTTAPPHQAWPYFLPDGRHALVTKGRETMAVDIESGATKRVFAGEQARYLPTGHLVYLAEDRRVRIVPFDPDRLEVAGSETAVIDNVFRGPGAGAAYFAVASRAGTLVYVQASFNRKLVVVDRNGRESPVPTEPRGYRFPRVSPDGKLVAVTVDPRPSDLWIVDLVRGSAERQQTPVHDGWGVWSPDGHRIAWLGSGIHVRAYPFAADEPRLIVPASVRNVYPRAWPTPDRILAETGQDLVTVTVSDGVVHPLVATPARENGGMVSPDGHWLAYESDASGTNDIYVQSYPDGNSRQLVSVGGGVDAEWARDGSELYYRRGNTIWGVRVRTGARFEVLGKPEALFSAPYDFTQTGNWATLPGGRFLMIKGDPTMTTRFQVVMNWFAELRAKR